jgi:mono/diheme cytochrome c family protein
VTLLLQHILFLLKLIVCSQLFSLLQARAESSNKSRDIPLQAFTLLEQYCGKCHGKGGSFSDEMSINYQRLIQDQFILPGAADESELFLVIKSGEMPPKKQNNFLSEEEVEIIRLWINSGAGDWNAHIPEKRDFISDEDIIRSIHEDIKKQKTQDRLFIRYFTLTHLYNAGEKESALDNYRLALAKLANSLSWKADIILPDPIDPSKTIMRIDLRHYGWEEIDNVWGKISNHYPYKINFFDKEFQSLCELINSQTPFIRADWFIANASIPPLYHEVLGLPDTDLEIEKRLGINVEQNLSIYPGKKVWRSGFLLSGVSNFNRIIERHKFKLGAYWKSYDFDANTGRKDIFNYPVDFEHAGGEIIFNLPNGLQAYLLTDEKGKRINEGPINIVFNKNGRDPVIVNGLSCMACHTRGMRKPSGSVAQLSDAINRMYFNDKKQKDYASTLYASENKMNELIDFDIERFEEAVSKLGGTTGGKEPIELLADYYHKSLNIDMVSAEVGLKPKDFTSELSKHAISNYTGLSLLFAEENDSKMIARDSWESLFGVVIAALGKGSIKESSDRYDELKKDISKQARNKWIFEALKKIEKVK